MKRTNGRCKERHDIAINKLTIIAEGISSNEKNPIEENLLKNQKYVGVTSLIQKEKYDLSPLSISWKL